MARAFHLAIFLLSASAVTLAANATFRFSNTLGSNMVLQRAPHQAIVWGWSTPVDTITVEMGNWVAPFKADENGLWKAQLPSTKEGGPYVVKATSTKAQTDITMENVMFGDVYLCGGQSNMQFTVDSAFNASEEVALASHYEDVRIFTVGQKTQSATPLAELGTIEQPWIAASAASIGGGNWTYFSAVCWFFGRDLYNYLGRTVPIGLVSTNWGGTCVQAWSSTDALAKCNQTLGGENMDNFQTEEAIVGGPSTPSNLYNAMIAPYLPMRVSGAIWYQGECNVGDSPQHGLDYYSCQFPAMIDDWREKFALPDMYFGFVQLAPWIAHSPPGKELVADIRQAQLAATKLQNVGMATAADLGDPTAPFGSVHPRNKQVVGYRLVQTVLYLKYHDVKTDGPVCTGAHVTDTKKSGTSAVVQVQIDYLPSTVGENLELHNATCPTGVPLTSCTTFQVQARSDNSWHAGKEEQVGENIVVTATVPIDSTSELHPVSAVRYGYSDWPVLTVYNNEKFPGVPFSIEIPLP